MDQLARISELLQRGEDAAVAEATSGAMAAAVPTKRILDEGLIAGMNVVGARFRDHEIFLPEVLLAARAMIAGLERLKPALIAEDVPLIGKAVIGTVQGDLHDIGKNLVGIMLEGAGVEVVDLGRDVSPERFVTAARESGARVIGMSALLTTTMPVMRRVIELIAREGLKGEIRTVVGGAPVSAEFAREIGADAYAFDGLSAVERVKRLLGVA